MSTGIRLVESIDEAGTTFEELSSRTGLSHSTLRRYLRELERNGFIERKGELFVLTSTGLLLKKALQSLKSGRSPQPYIVTDPSTSQPLPLSFRNYRQLLAIIDYGLADRSVLEEHVRKYLAKWARESLGDEYLAYMLENGLIKSLEDLRRYIEMILDALE